MRAPFPNRRGVKRTATFDVDGEPFEFVCDITKANTLPDGRRIIRGVASGVAEDRDGERVSSNALRKMARQPLAGGAVKITSSHDQDWLTEFGDVVKVEHDPEHDELLVEAELPPEGVDPIADKAWLKANSEKLGFSIGGKLRKAYYELADRGGRVVKRKVLDEIDLRHVALTKKPSYKSTFAECVAKTFEGPGDVADVEFVDADVFKAQADRDQDAEQAPDASSQDPAAATPTEEAGADATPAATGDTSSDAQDAQSLPQASRHLSCPNCGEEFAAPMPDGDDAGSNQPPNDQDEGDAHKTSEKEPPVDTITDTVAKLRTLAEEADDVATKTETAAAEAEVTKTDDEAVETVDADVAKTAVERLDDVERMLAASHRHNTDAVEVLKTQTAEGFGEIVKAVTGLRDAVLSMPQGRRSLARILPPSGEAEVEKTATETDDVAKAETPLDALKALNRKHYGIQ